MAARPIEERLDHADLLARGYFDGLVYQGYIDGAFPFGSAQSGVYTPSSDFDIVVATPEGSIEQEMDMYREMHVAAVDIYRQTQVSLDVTCFSSRQLADGTHDFADFMVDELWKARNAAPENVIGHDFVASLHYKRPAALVGANNLAADYANRKHPILLRQWLQGCYFAPHDLLSTVLSMPHLVGRKVAWSLGATEPSVPRSVVAETMYRHFGGESEIYALYTELTADANRYNTLLLPGAEQLTPTEYDQLIESTLEVDLPKVIELLRRLQQTDVHKSVR